MILHYSPLVRYVAGRVGAGLPANVENADLASYGLFGLIDAIEKINAALNKALALQAVKDRLAQGASQPLGPSTPEQADAYGQAQRAKWVPFIRALQINVG